MAVNLIIQDVNDNLPRFQLQNYVAYIREAQGYDFPIIQVKQRRSLPQRQLSRVCGHTVQRTLSALKLELDKGVS